MRIYEWLRIKRKGTDRALRARLSRLSLSKPYTLTPKPFSRGFTLVELVVSISIFVTITSIIMVSQHRFGGNILIANLAYDVALSIREAQVYGVSVRSAGQAVPSGQQFQKSYGIHFGPSGYYILFADINNDDKYIPAEGNTSTGCIPGSECVSFFKIEQGNAISRFCSSFYFCTDSAPPQQITGLDILFKRPNPEPIVRAYDVNGMVIYNANPGTAMVTVISPQSLTKIIDVLPSGQIAVQ